MEQATKGSFSLLKECKKCGHTLLDHATRRSADSELEVGSCKECNCQKFAE
jgi:hypothetical protein